MKRKKKKNRMLGVAKSLFFIVVGMFLMYAVICILDEFPSLLGNKNHKDIKVNTSENIIDGCVNLNIFNTAVCLRENVRSFYNYNVSNTDKDLTFEELKQQGGVCSHYSSLYYNAGRTLDFYSREVTIYVDDDTGHIFTIISDTDGYCLLDEINIQCYKFVDGEIKNE